MPANLPEPVTVDLGNGNRATCQVGADGRTQLWLEGTDRNQLIQLVRLLWSSRPKVAAESNGTPDTEG